MTTHPGNLLLLGDFNYHVDDASDKMVKSFMELTQSANLIQHVKQATHDHGHILDLVLTREDELDIKELHLDSSIKSDHSAIIFHPLSEASQYHKDD